MKLEHLLEEFGKKKGLGKLSLDSTEKCRFVVNKSFVISYEKSLDGNGFFMYSVVAQVPPDREKEISLMALQGNLFRKETGEASLGYLTDTHALVLFEYHEEANMDYPTFDHAFESFLGYLAFWKNKVALEAEPNFEEVSLDKHIFNLQQHKDFKIFFA